jgi:sugar lactone lactonase YvrE
MTTPKKSAECVWPLSAELGESPVWCAAEQALYFVDIYGDRVHRYTPTSGARDTIAVAGQHTSFLVPKQGGGFVAGGRHVVGDLDLGAGRIVPWFELDEPEHNRLNDGKCSPAGRLYTATMDETRATDSGRLYAIDGTRTPTPVDFGYTVSNGPAFSPDGRVAYHAETSKATIYAFDVKADGSLEGKREFLVFDDGSRPDGMTVDADGCLWATRSRGFRVTRFSPAGEPLFEVEVPASKVTSCAFGGPDYRTLFITSLRVGFDAATLEKEPLAGGLFAVELDVTGLPPAQFAS